MSYPVVFSPAGMDPDARAVEQLRRCLADERVTGGALMADHHLGYSMPIGGVVAYRDAVSPSGVGFDIACGNLAVKTSVLVSDFLPGDLKKLGRSIQQTVAFGLGRRSADPLREHPVFGDPRWELVGDYVPDLPERAVVQLGTVGSGNHYVDLLAGVDGHLWVANHFGSRGFGHTIATVFINLAHGRAADAGQYDVEEPAVLSTDSPAGRDYIALMQLAGEYAYAGREFVADQVVALLGASRLESIHNHHNYAWFDGGSWIVRKGATPLSHVPAYIGGSMGEGAAIVCGNGSAIGALGSAPHGAGRVMSRTAAAGKLRKMWVCGNRDCPPRLAVGLAMPDPCPSCGEKKLRKLRLRDLSTAAVDWAAARAELAGRGIHVFGADADEAPAVYKPLRDVLAAHSNVRVLEWLDPLVVVMAGPDTRDPYKD